MRFLPRSISLSAQLIVVMVGLVMATTLALTVDVGGLDPGELHLLAHALGHFEPADESWRLCSHDARAIAVAIELGMRDRLVALETLTSAGGQKPKPPLRAHFTEGWVSKTARDVWQAAEARRGGRRRDTA